MRRPDSPFRQKPREHGGREKRAALLEGSPTRFSHKRKHWIKMPRTPTLGRREEMYHRPMTQDEHSVQLPVRQGEVKDSGVFGIFVAHDGKRFSKRVGDKKTADEVARKFTAKLTLGGLAAGRKAEPSHRERVLQAVQAGVSGRLVRETTPRYLHHELQEAHPG